MIDWLNFWIGIVFAFAGISIIISAVKYYLPCFYRYLLVVFIGVVFIATGGGLILNSSTTFDSTLHECTEWKSPADFSYSQFNEAMDNKFICVQGCPQNFDELGSAGYDAWKVCETSCDTKYFKHFECVRFREKPIEELASAEQNDYSLTICQAASRNNDEWCHCLSMYKPCLLKSDNCFSEVKDSKEV